MRTRNVSEYMLVLALYAKCYMFSRNVQPNVTQVQLARVLGAVRSKHGSVRSAT